MPVNVEVQGLARLQRTIARAGLDMNDFSDPHRAATRIIVATARAIAPKRTGALAGSIRASSSSRSAAIRAGTGPRGRVPYAEPIHWGWPARRIRAQPFLSQAATATESEWIGDFKDHIDRTLDEVRGI